LVAKSICTMDKICNAKFRSFLQKRHRSQKLVESNTTIYCKSTNFILQFLTDLIGEVNNYNPFERNTQISMSRKYSLNYVFQHKKCQNSEPFRLI
jgi:hypothetical protein